MDWTNCIADVEKILPCSYTAGREQGIFGITLHHNAGNLTIDDCYRVWCNSETSAHYQVDENGTVGQLVNDCDTAWACGNWYANTGTISIEHANDNSDPWTIFPAALESGAHLTAALCRLYGLGEPEWMVNVFPHSHWSATACPGEIAGSQNAEYMRRAKEWYRAMTGGTEPAQTPQPKPQPKPQTDGLHVRYRACTQASGWLPEMIDRTDTSGYGDDYAGDGSPITYLAMDFPGWYQVQTVNSGWLPRVSSYNVDDLENGCAGDGSPIIGVRCYYETKDPNTTGWKAIHYAVNDLAEMRDNDADQYGDDFAGNGETVTKFYAYIGD